MHVFETQCSIILLRSDLRMCFLALQDRRVSLSELNSSVPAALGIGGTSGRTSPAAALLKRRDNGKQASTLCYKINNYIGCLLYTSDAADE